MPIVILLRLVNGNEVIPVPHDLRWCPGFRLSLSEPERPSKTVHCKKTCAQNAQETNAISVRITGYEECAGLYMETSHPARVATKGFAALTDPH